MSFHIVSSLLNPADAARFTGRYETEVEGKDGQPIKVLRSIRKANLDELLLQGNITPIKGPKAPALYENAVDDLCNLFETKVSVTKSPKATSKIAAAVDSAKVRRIRRSRNEHKSIIEGDEGTAKVEEKVQGGSRKKTSAPGASPMRRSRRISDCACTRSRDVN